MTKVFVSGSKSIKNLDAKVKERLDNLVASNFDVIVGDADGVDASIQKYLAGKRATKAVVYCSGSRPRNNLGEWKVVPIQTDLAAGTRAFYTAKDLRMAEDADFGLMIWDAKSTGTLNNVIELLTRQKKSVVFVNKNKAFHVVREPEDFRRLLSAMSDQSLAKAEEKVLLSKRLAQIESKLNQKSLFPDA